LSRPDRLAVDTPMSRSNPTLFESSQSQPLDRKSACALLYLALPVALFFAGWFKPLFAAVLLMGLALGLYHALRSVFSDALHDPIAPTWPWVLGLAALAWTCLGGLATCFMPMPIGASATPCCAI